MTNDDLAEPDWGVGVKTNRSKCALGSTDRRSVVFPVWRGPQRKKECFGRRGRTRQRLNHLFLLSGISEEPRPIVEKRERDPEPSWDIYRQGAKPQSSVNDSDNNWRQSFGAEAVSLKYSVMRNNSQLLDTGLSDEHPIERIAVHRR